VVVGPIGQGSDAEQDLAVDRVEVTTDGFRLGAGSRPDHSIDRAARDFADDEVECVRIRPRSKSSIVDDGVTEQAALLAVCAHANRRQDLGRIGSGVERADLSGAAADVFDGAAVCSERDHITGLGVADGIGHLEVRRIVGARAQGNHPDEQGRSESSHRRDGIAATPSRIVAST
jgi:hypothetical protein